MGVSRSASKGVLKGTDKVNVPQGKWEVSARSETGYVREENQDRMSGAHVSLGEVYIVADGLGGHKGGAMAAELTVQCLQEHLTNVSPESAVEDALRTAFEHANVTVYERANSGDSATEGMGSTAVLLLTSGPVARVAHVGDSRAYLYRQGRLRKLTRDHTKVQRMVDAGILTPEQAHDHPDAAVLERAIGQKPTVQADISSRLSLKEGDAILLCSDGLWSYVTSSDIEAVLRSAATVQEIPERLVKMALDKGSEDNVTVQFIQYGQRIAGQPRAREIEEKSEETQKAKNAPVSYHIALAAIVSAALSALAVVGVLYFLKPGEIRGEATSLGLLQEKLERAEQVKREADQRAEESATRVTSLESELQESKRNVDRLESEVEGLQEKLRVAEEELENAEQLTVEDRGEFDKQLSDLRKKLQTAEKAKTKAEQRAKTAEGAKLKADERAKTAEDAKLQAEQRAKTAANSLHELEKQLKDLQEKGETTEKGNTQAERGKPRRPMPIR